MYVYIYIYICRSSPLAPCSRPISFHGVTIAGRAYRPKSSTSHAGSTPILFVK